MLNILITDGENRSALAATRSLGKKGCRVVVTGKKDASLASSSKYCFKGIAVPDPVQFGSQYISAIKDIIIRQHIDYIFPMTEVSIFLLNKIREQIYPRVILACPPDDKMAAVSNKYNLFICAEKLNVPMPATYYIKNINDFKSLVHKIIKYPVVVKPALSKIPHGKAFLSGQVMYAASQKQLEHLYETRVVLQYPSIIQERIDGMGLGLFTLFDEDRHLSLFAHRRLREKPPSGGVSVFSESIPLNKEMVDVSGRLLSSVGWRGIAMVEFKHDRKDGKAKLMEINGRFWGSLQLAISSGIDFPSIYLDYLQGKKPSDGLQSYRIGHRMKWFFGTMDHLIIRLKNRNKAIDHHLNTSTKWRALLDFLKIWEEDCSFDVFDRDDLGPFWFETRNYFRR